MKAFFSERVTFGDDYVKWVLVYGRKTCASIGEAQNFNTKLDGLRPRVPRIVVHLTLNSYIRKSIDGQWSQFVLTDLELVTCVVFLGVVWMGTEKRDSMNPLISFFQ